MRMEIALPSSCPLLAGDPALGTERRHARPPEQRSLGKPGVTLDWQSSPRLLLDDLCHRRTDALGPAGGRHITVFWDRCVLFWMMRICIAAMHFCLVDYASPRFGSSAGMTFHWSRKRVSFNPSRLACVQNGQH
jgi:hypothetical protein